MAQARTMPRFSEFPLEIRSLIWRGASLCGSMRLDVFEHFNWFPFTRQRGIYLLPADRQSHVLHHQRQRFAVYRASREAQRECLRWLTKIPLSLFPLCRTRAHCERTVRGWPPNSHATLLMDWSSDLMLIEFNWGSMLRPQSLEYHGAEFGWAHVTRFAVDDRKFCQTDRVNLEQVERWLRRLASVREIFFVLDSHISKQAALHHSSRTWAMWAQWYGLDLRAPLETVDIDNMFVGSIAWMREPVQYSLATAGIFRQKLAELGRDGIEVRTVIQLS